MLLNYGGQEYLINMPYIYIFPNATQPDNILVQTITTVPSFIPGFLLFVFFTVFFGGTSRQKLRTGTADYPMWAVIASLSIFMLSLIMGIVSGVISLEWTVIVLVITIFCGVWLFLDRRINEG